MYLYLISFIVILLIFLYVTKKIETFKNELLSFKKKKEYLLFSSIGEKSCYKQWLGKNKEYDVVLYLFETIPNFNSNEAGINLQVDQHFFERIDYILYAGGKGVQYSLMKPMIKSFAPKNIDYASSDFMEFSLNLV